MQSVANLQSFAGAASHLSVPVSLVRRMAHTGLIPVVRVPRSSPRVDVQDVRKALQRYTYPPAQSLELKAG